MSFESVLERNLWSDVTARIDGAARPDVERALFTKGRRSFDDFLALVSPAAREYLPLMAEESQRITQRRFGKTIQLYAPMYLSNECQNICTYCGFSFHNKIERKTLTDDEILAEIAVIKSHGYDHILLVSGEAQKTVGSDYFERAVRLIRPHFSHISLEVQPLEEAEYRRLMDAGVQTVLVYQETYNRERYKSYHPKGKKSNFSYRLDTPERLGRATPKYRANPAGVRLGFIVGQRLTGITLAHAVTYKGAIDQTHLSQIYRLFHHQREIG